MMQVAIIFLKSISLLIFVMEHYGVFFEVRAELLSVI